MALILLIEVINNNELIMITMLHLTLKGCFFFNILL